MVQKGLSVTNYHAKRKVIGICKTTSNPECTRTTLYGAPVTATDETTTSVEIDVQITAANSTTISYIINGIYVNTNNNNNNNTPIPIPSPTSYTFTSTTSTDCTGLLTNISFGTGTYDPSGNQIEIYYNGTLPLTQTSNGPTIYQNNSDGTPIVYTQNLDTPLPSGSYSCNFYYWQNSNYTSCVVEPTSIGSINTFSFTVS